MQPILPIPQDILARCRAVSAATLRPVAELLAEALSCPIPTIVQQLGVMLHYPVIGMEELRKLTPDFQLFSFSEASSRQALVVLDGKGHPQGILSDPFNDALIALLQERVAQPLQWSLAASADITAYLALQEDSLRAVSQMLDADEDAQEVGRVGEGLSLRSIAEDSSPVVKLANSTLYDALKSGASDIHLESSAHGMTIKYRIDGVLIKGGSVPGVEIAEQLISRIKVLAELDIAEKRVPQDGRFKVTIQGRDVDVRVSIIPSIQGEDAVLRILDRKSHTEEANGLNLERLGFNAASLVSLRKLAAEPYGMLLVTGPTGSGKTTTLYAALSEINNGSDKIITIEDPVEYQLPGIKQIPVNEKKGLTFAKGLRAILRHDPDKILVGEIRDEETAQIAIQSALTGHLVFTTVHANNVFDVLGRFIHMGVDSYSFVSALNGILAQRLVRVICPHCATETIPDDALLQLSGISQADAEGYRFMNGHGCGNCRGTGYKGRKAIAEILHLNDELREMIVAREPIRKIKAAARANGMHTLRESALELVRNGETTLYEINRTTFAD
ncbi:MAG: type II/IV secretion system protein [Nitrosomonadales bacterium]|nr:type II/IV secretion system protein [Nitrosomonadales bacterium]